LSIDGLLLWLDSADTTAVNLSGTDVTQWNDKSPNSNHFSVGGGYNPPVYAGSKAGIFFNSNQVMMSANPVRLDKNTSVFFVGSIFNSRDDFNYIVSFHGNDLSFRWNPRHRFGDSNDSDFCNDSGYIINGVRATEGSYDITQKNLINFVVERGSYGNLTLGPGMPQGWRWCCDRFFKGVIYELIIFSSPLTSSQTRDVQTYLVNKWK